MSPAKKPVPVPVPDPDPAEPVLIDVIRDYDGPVTPTILATLTDLPVARVTEILDDLVSDGSLALGDDQFYRTPADDLDEVEVEVAPADTPPRTVAIPTSDLLRFLSDINLPPQSLEGLGVISAVAGFIEFRPLAPTQDDPRPTGEFRVVVQGTHAAHFTPANRPS